jgi:hypothetical protein
VFGAEDAVDFGVSKHLQRFVGGRPAVAQGLRVEGADEEAGGDAEESDGKSIAKRERAVDPDPRVPAD